MDRIAPWLAALCLAAGFGQAATLEGRVVGVADGDTITILDSSKKQYRIRINGIDAPEKGQPYGNRSRDNLSRMVAA